MPARTHALCIVQTLSQREYDLLARKFEHDSDVNYVAFADYIDPENSVHQSILVTVLVAPSQLMRSVANASGVWCG